jgi:hypothetical protein
LPAATATATATVFNPEREKKENAYRNSSHFFAQVAGAKL